MIICEECINGDSCCNYTVNGVKISCEYFNKGNATDCYTCDLKKRCVNFSVTEEKCRGFVTIEKVKKEKLDTHAKIMKTIEDLEQ